MPPTATQSPAELQRARQKREDEESAGRSRPEPEPDLPGEAEDEQPEEELTQMAVEGYEDLTVKIGGGKPDQAVLVIQGGEYKLRKGQFPLEGRVCLIIEGNVEEVAVRNLRDSKTKAVTSRKKKHVLVPDRMEDAPIGTTAKPTEG